MIQFARDAGSSVQSSRAPRWRQRARNNCAAGHEDRFTNGKAVGRISEYCRLRSGSWRHSRRIAGEKPMDTRRLAFSAATMGVCNVGKIALQLVLTPLLARLLGPAEFGLYGLAM